MDLSNIFSSSRLLRCRLVEAGYPEEDDEPNRVEARGAAGMLLGGWMVVWGILHINDAPRRTGFLFGGSSSDAAATAESVSCRRH